MWAPVQVGELISCCTLRPDWLFIRAVSRWGSRMSRYLETIRTEMKYTTAKARNWACLLSSCGRGMTIHHSLFRLPQNTKAQQKVALFSNTILIPVLKYWNSGRAESKFTFEGCQISHHYYFLYLPGRRLRHTHKSTLTTSRNTTARRRLMSSSCRRRSGSLMGDRLLGTVSMAV